VRLPLPLEALEGQRRGKDPLMLLPPPKILFPLHLLLFLSALLFPTRPFLSVLLFLLSSLIPSFPSFPPLFTYLFPIPSPPQPNHLPASPPSPSLREAVIF